MRETNKRRMFGRYILVVLLILVFGMFVLWDAVKITVIHAAEWNQKADSVLMLTTPIEPERGKILAENGSVLAANLHFFTVRVDWTSGDIKDDTLKKYLPALCDSLHAFDSTRTATQWKDALLAAKKVKKNTAYRLFQNLSHVEYMRVKSFPFFNKTRGLYAERSNARCKPYGTMASRSIGTTGESKNRFGVHGHSGLEMALDSLLYGIPGEAKRIQITNSIVNWQSKPAVKGYDITTTINVQLQDIVETELYNMLKTSNADWGTAVLMETATGEIKAISNLEWNEGRQDFVEGRNNAVLGYEPGSVMKPISMMVALNDGIVTNIDEQFPTGNKWIYSGKAITDHPGAPYLSPREVIERSSNIGMSKIIVRKYGSNPGGFRQSLEKIGFFEPFYTGIGGERVPQIAHLGNTNADRVALTRVAFGYTSLIPPMHILGMYNAIANDGKFVRPHLVKKLSREGEPDSIVPVSYIRRQVCSPENAAKLRLMLHDVVYGDHGTARIGVKNDTVEIAGKTGTAYIVQDNGKYGAKKRLAFCGFFPYQHPLYTCVVLILGADRGAAYSSGRVLRNIAIKMYARGMLNNSSDYRNDATGRNSAPTVSATFNASRNTALCQTVGLKHLKVLGSPKRPGGKSMPDVVGLSAREAIRRLETLGMTVRCHGAGVVRKQSLAAGSAYQRGEMIYLELHNGV